MHDETPSPYQVFMLALCFVAIGLLAVQTFAGLTPEALTLLNHADTAVSFLFLADFVYSFVKAKDRKQYFVRWGWLDLLSSIPYVGVLRLGRLARILRIFRVLRGFRATRLLTNFLLRRRAESAVLSSALVVLLILLAGSVAALQVEQGADINIRTAGDAVWWAASTITTVGYGDRFPVTAEGRLVGVFLMTAGVGLFGTLSGLIASWFLAPAEKREVAEAESIKAEILALRSQMTDLANIIARR